MPESDHDKLKDDLKKKLNKQYLKLFIKLRGTKNDEFYQILPLILGYAIKLTLVDLILNGNKIFLVEEQFIQMIQFIHSLIYGIDISYSYSLLLKNQYSRQILNELVKKHAAPSALLPTIPIMCSPRNTNIKNPKRSLFKRRGGFTTSFAKPLDDGELEYFDYQMQQYYDEQQIKEFDEKKKRIMCPNLKPSFISSYYGKQLQAKQRYHSLERFETSFVSPSMAQELQSADTVNPLKITDKRKLKHVKSLLPLKEPPLQKFYDELFPFHKNARKMHAQMPKQLEVIQEAGSPIPNKRNNTSISQSEIINPFLPDIDKNEALAKPKPRDLKFKVGIQISEDGSCSNSFGLRHVEKMRQVLRYRPGESGFNVEEANQIMEKVSQYKQEIGVPVDKKLDSDDEKNENQKKSQFKKKERYRERLEQEEDKKIIKDDNEQIKQKYLERLIQEQEIFKGSDAVEGETLTDEYSRNFQSNFIKEHSQNQILRAREQRVSKKKTQLELINIAEKLRKVKMKIEMQKNPFISKEQTEEEFSEFIDKFQEECNKEVKIAKRFK